MKVSSPCDVGHFAILQTHTANNGPTANGAKHGFWFPFKKVAAGEFVVVYTKRGKMSEKDHNGVKSHFFYWGLDISIWADQKVSAVLLYAPEWTVFDNAAPELTP